MATEQTHVRTLDLISLETNSQLAVASTGTAYSKSFIWPKGGSYSVEYKISSAAGSVDVKVEIESGDVPPTTEGSADTTNYAVGNTINSSMTTDDEVQYAAPSPTVSKYCRFKFTGQGSNNADTIVDELKIHYTD